MTRLAPRAVVLLAAAVAAPAVAQCQLCAAVAGPAAKPTPTVPLSIAIESALDFSRAAHLSANGAGSIDINERNGSRTVRGLADLGGVTLVGRVRVLGEPRRQIRVALPATITLTAPDGTVATVTGIKADIPTVATLSTAGELLFTIGGRLSVTGGAAGEFRGRIAITADYQ